MASWLPAGYLAWASCTAKEERRKRYNHCRVLFLCAYFKNLKRGRIVFMGLSDVVAWHCTAPHMWAYKYNQVQTIGALWPGQYNIRDSASEQVVAVSGPHNIPESRERRFPLKFIVSILGVPWGVACSISGHKPLFGQGLFPSCLLYEMK